MWMKILGCLGDGVARSCGVVEFRKHGISAHSWSPSKKNIRAAAAALTAVEDWLELKSQTSTVENRRMKIRAVRRWLEDAADL